jgi:diacylglycerol kinase
MSEERAMNDEFQVPARNWPQRFRDAFRGVALAARTERSYRVHFFFAALVFAAGAVLQVTAAQWCLLTLCIALVLSAETFNSALERMAKAIDRRRNPELAAALDMGSGAVLLSAFGSVVTGVIIFLPRLIAALAQLGSP